MRILVLGGDGYLGWPTAMYLTRRGHEVHVVDNYLRRRAHVEQGTDSLTPILDNLPAPPEAVPAETLPAETLPAPATPPIPVTSGSLGIGSLKGLPA